MLVAQPNKLRQKLQSGQCAMGTAAFSFSPNIIEAMGYAGLDFVRIDTEHAWRRDESVPNMVRAALISGICPIIRVDRDDPYLVRKALEVGGGGIIVPDIHTVEQAKEVSAAAKFPPVGIRGFSGACISGAWGARDGAEWKTWSDTQPMIGIMIENVKAMDCIDQIMAVEGIDFALFGPADYSMSLGLAGPQPKNPKVQEGLQRTINAARKVGKHAVFTCGLNDDDIRHYHQMGLTMFEFGSDAAIVHGTLKGKVATFGDLRSA
jgi:4-hydroxy-2-oxoheptanedioate aldolase